MIMRLVQFGKCGLGTRTFVTFVMPSPIVGFPILALYMPGFYSVDGERWWVPSLRSDQSAMAISRAPSIEIWSKICD